jgi:hypothetical protein
MDLRWPRTVLTAPRPAQASATFHYRVKEIQ